jgi:hypothetical protein
MILGSKSIGSLTIGSDGSYTSLDKSLSLSSPLIITSVITVSPDVSYTHVANIIVSSIVELAVGQLYTHQSSIKLEATSSLSESSYYTHTGNLLINFNSEMGGVFTTSHSLIITGNAVLGGGFAHNVMLLVQSSTSLLSGILYNLQQNLIVNALHTLNIAGIVDTSALQFAGRSGICLNMITGGHSSYTNFHFDRFITNKNRYYGVYNGVSYELTGIVDDTTPIDWEIRYPIIDFGTPQRKNLQDVYVYMRSNGDVELVTLIDDNKERTGYYVTWDDRTGIHRRRKLLPKGILGTAWQVVIRSVDGSTIELHNLEVCAEKAQRV